MKIYLARHGQSNYNEVGLCNSNPRTDVYLTPVGIVQAGVLAKKLEFLNFDRIYVSQLKRTQQTAAVINQLHRAPIAIDGRLNDNRTGFEDQPSVDFYEAMKNATDKWNARFNDGESFVDVRNRAGRFLDDLQTQPVKTVLIVTSKIIVQAIYARIQGLSNQEAWDLPVLNGSCYEIEAS